ncbi:hypothetical protein [Bacillus velezensis]|uniref:hypothetical protein n=1 Tax=Bacillus velezensis TaxID=492670 RepID=UPI0011A481F0|nr:hypothetical protein [Bacillus velezensis]
MECYSLLSSAEKIKDRMICVYCGEECSVHTGSYHRNELDEYYCTCEGAKSETMIRRKQSGLRAEIQRLDHKISDMKKQGKQLLEQKMFEIEMGYLIKKYRVDAGEALVKLSKYISKESKNENS